MKFATAMGQTGFRGDPEASSAFEQVRVSPFGPRGQIVVRRTFEPTCSQKKQGELLALLTGSDDGSSS